MSTTTSSETGTLAQKITLRSHDQASIAVATDLGGPLSFITDILTADGFNPAVDTVRVGNAGRSITATWSSTHGVTADGKTIAIQLDITHDKSRKVYTATSKLVAYDGEMIRMVIAFDPESPWTPHKIAVEPAARFARARFVRFATDVLETVTGGQSASFLHNLALAPQLVGTRY